jgi:Skp family chaperone for outer membrane proteins
MSSIRNIAWVLALCSAAIATSGCGVNVHSPNVRGIGYIRLDDAIKHHPLYSQLAQLDDAIAAIDLAAAVPRVPLSAKQIAAQTKVLDAELIQAQKRTNAILESKQEEYRRREGQAVAAALKAAGVKGAGAFAAAQMSATSAQQAQQAAQAAGEGFLAYQQSVVAQGNAAGAAVARQLQAEAAQKYRAKAAQLSQNETNLSLRLSQQDAPQVLAIKTKLSNLAMDEADRKKLTAQLAALQAHENSVLQQQRQADDAELSAYRAQLNRQTAQAIQRQLASISAQTRSEIEERRNEVGAQLRALGGPVLPANLPSGVRAKIAGIQAQFTAQFRADAQRTIGDYLQTKADLDRQFAALHGADVGATGAAAKELDALQKRRADLYRSMVSQIQREAKRLAERQGFSIVFSHVAAAAGGYDMTNELIKDLESLKQ